MSFTFLFSSSLCRFRAIAVVGHSTAIRLRSMEADGLYSGYRRGRKKDDSSISTFGRLADLASEITDHPDSRLAGLAADGEMTAIRRGESPKRRRLWLLPKRLGSAVQVDM